MTQKPILESAGIVWHTHMVHVHECSFQQPSGWAMHTGSINCTCILGGRCRRVVRTKLNCRGTLMISWLFTVVCL